MLQLHSFTYNPFQENTYIIYNELKQCWIVDPGMMDTGELQHFTEFIRTNALQPQAIINTHAHIDHILGVDAVAKTYNIPFLLHEQERVVLERAGDTAKMFGFIFPGVQTPPQYIREGAMDLGEDRLGLLFVPGHSPGSIAFYYAPGNWLIAGDTLFRSSIGRTDLPGGDHPTLIRSIKEQLLVLPGHTSVHPGHGPATTVQYELGANDFLR